MSTSTLGSSSTRTNTRRRMWWVLTSVAALVLLAGCQLNPDPDPLPPGSDQFPETTDTLDEPDAPAAEATSCDRAREAFLTGTPGEIKSALRALIADKKADADARENAQQYLNESDADLRDMYKQLVQTYCSA